MKYLDYPCIHELGAKQSLKQLLAEHHKTAQELFLTQKSGVPLWFNLTPGLLRLLSTIDEYQGFLRLQNLPKKLISSEMGLPTRSEAYYSSRIEGAVTSIDEAFGHMDSKQNSFADESMQMIQNNKRGIDFLWKNSAKAIDHKLMHALHKLLVFNTHKERPITVGAYRKGTIYVVNGRGEIIYEGPKFEMVPQLMDDYIKWVNNTHGSIHPFVKSAVAHFYFVHVHPYDDGNGRSTRALAHLVLYKDGYDITKLIAPSLYIEKHRSDYYRAIQDVRAHEGDLTYFLIYIAQAFVSEMGRLVASLSSPSSGWQANARQAKALAYARKQQQPLTTQVYMKINRCSDELARRDFNGMLEAGVLVAQGQGRARKYTLKS